MKNLRKNTALDESDEKEKKELRKLTRSVSLRKDFRIIRENHKASIKRKKLTLDDYIEFLKVCWRFSNYQRKPFKKITGSYFRI